MPVVFPWRYLPVWATPDSHPGDLSTQATLTLEQVEGNWTITAVHLDLSARVPRIDPAKFEELADQSKAGCIVSRVLKADITLTKKLTT
jgi:lipoyl-dependent peroxiredoxin